MKIRITTLLVFITFYMQASVIYVDASSMGSNNGTSWSNAFTDLQSAITIAVDGDEVWVAQGTYVPTSGTDRYIYLELKNGVKWYGGFNGTETELAQRDPSNNISLLSGDIGMPNDSTDNSYTIVYTEYCDSTTILDGFTISYANADSDLVAELFRDRAKSGGGLYINGTGIGNTARPIVNRCLFANNTTRFLGAAIFCNGFLTGSATPLITNCAFTDNTNLGSGGAVYTDGVGFYDTEIRNCIFLRNQSSNGGAIGVFDTHGSGGLLIDGCTFEENRGSNGGDIRIEDMNDSSFTRIENSTFTKSIATSQGASISLYTFDSSRDFKVENCDFYEINDSPNSYIIRLRPAYGDPTPKELLFLKNRFRDNITNEGVLVASHSNKKLELKVIDCEFTNNTIGTGGAMIEMRNFGSTITTKNTLFFQNTIASGGNIIYSIGATNTDDTARVKVANSIFWGNSFQTNSHHIRGANTLDFDLQNCLVDAPDCDQLHPDLSTNTEIILNCQNMIYDLDPQFINSTDLDFRLKPCSPAINAGDNSLLDSIQTTDVLGNPRIAEDIVDLGPYEVVSQFVVSSVTQVTCNGAATGAAFFDFENAVLPLSYQWDNGQATGTNNTDLQAGDYSFTVSDADGCSREALVTISEPDPLQFDASLSNASGMDQADGMIQISNVTGGTAGYLFEWSNGETTESIENLLPGEYFLTITDDAGCENTFSFQVDFTISVENPDQEASGFWINPGLVKSGETFDFYMKNQTNEQLEIQMFNAQGALVFRNKYQKSTITFSTKINAPTTPGIYFINVLSNKKLETLKILVID